MVMVKFYTDIFQSKKLAEFLPFESADMSWVPCDDGNKKYFRAENRRIILNYEKKNWIPCWSGTALLNILPDGTDIMKDKTDTENEKYMCSVGVKEEVLYTFGSNPVDVCYEMILRLHELKML